MSTGRPVIGGTVTAWDGPTRLFHWLLVLLVLSAWASYEFASALGDRLMVWHRVNGLAILVLVVWRIIWGFAGSSTARFAGFVRGPAAVLAYAASLISGPLRRYLGHNPLGALMVLALLAVLFSQACFGLFAIDDNDLVGGPLHRLVEEDTTKWATGWHGRIFDFVLLPLIGLHIVANVLYGVVKKEPLIPAMIAGTKPTAPYEDATEAEIAANVTARALLCLAAAIAIVLGTILLAGGRLP